MKKKNNKPAGCIRKCLPFVMFFALPFGCVLLIKPEWLGRLLATGIFFCLGAGLGLWYGFCPKSRIITKEAKLSNPEFKKVKPRITLILRTLFVTLGLILLWQGLFFSIDTAEMMAKSNYTFIQGRVKLNNSPFGMWFLRQGIVLDDKEGKEKSYGLMYSLAPRLKRNTNYEFLVLRRSRIILEARELKEMTK